ncbi:MAG: hypothetical protein ACOY4L_12630 [Pseudomonadota bacterium]
MSEAVTLRPLAGLKLRQHINLYRDGFAPKSVAFSARFMLIYTLLLILALGIFAALLKRSEIRAQHTLAQAQQNLAQSQAQLDELEARMGPGRRASLAAEVARLEAQVKDRQTILQFMDTRLQQDQISPAQVLNGLAAAHRKGIWLTGIHTANGAREIVLEGGALSAGDLPGYIDALNAQYPFRKARFRMFSAGDDLPPAQDRQRDGNSASSAASPYLHFRLASGVTPDAKDSAAQTGGNPR